MASRGSLRQVSQILKNKPSQLQSPRTRNYSSLLPSTSTRSRNTSRIPCFYTAQQSRNLSLWGSGSPKPTSPTADPASSNLPIIEPHEFDSARTIRAHDTSSDFSSHNPNPIEPQFVEDVQQAIAGSASSGHIPPLDQVPERLGYMVEVAGLNHGWGPTASVQWLLEHIHIWGGLGWTASIAVMALVIRGSIIPMMITAQRETAKLREMGIASKPIKDELATAKAQGDTVKVQQLSLQMRDLMQSYGVNFFKVLAPILVQLPLGFGAWKTLRHAAEAPLPGFVHESWFWNHDLTFSDEFYLFPLASAALIYLSATVNSSANKAAGTSLANPDAMKLLMYVFPVVTFAFVSFQPGAVQLYFVSSTAMGALTAWLMTLTVWRTYFGLPAIKSAAPAATSPPGPATPPFMKSRRSRVINASARQVPSSQDAAAAAAAATQNISALDKGVDSVKKTFSGAFGSMRETTEDWAKKSATKSERAAAAKRQAEADIERRARNKALGGQDETPVSRRRR